MSSKVFSSYPSLSFHFHHGIWDLGGFCVSLHCSPLHLHLYQFLLAQLGKEGLQQTTDDGCDKKGKRWACFFIWTFQGRRAGVCSERASLHDARSEGKAFIAVPNWEWAWEKSSYPHNWPAAAWSGRVCRCSVTVWRSNKQITLKPEGGF